MIKSIVTIILTISLLYAGEYFTGFELVLSFHELNTDNLLTDILAFTIAFTLATMLVKIFEPIEQTSEVETKR